MNMKRYLMTGIAALAMGGMFTSCSHDMSLYNGDGTKAVVDKYEQAFVDAYGEPDANQTWGFGEKTTTVAGTRGMTRSVPSSPTFKDGDCPSMPTKYKNTLAEAIADGAKYAKDYQNYQKGDVIYINTDYQTLNNPQNTEDLIIYVDGNVTYFGQTNQNGTGTTICVTEGSTLKLGQVSERLTIYLAPNATLDITEQLDWQGNPSPSKEYVWNASKNQNDIFEKNTFTFTKDNAALYMNTGSQVLGDVIYFKDGYTVLNESGTITTNELHVENGAILYNKNEVIATGVIALRNTNGEIDNFGTMEGASMTLDANSRFNNVAGGEVTISGLTKINNDSGNNAWQNNGQFNTGSFEITGGCQDPVAFNNCHMSVTNKFFMNHGNFVLDGGAAVECGSFEWQDDNYFHMGGKALLKVTGQLLANNDDTGYGFYGDDTDYAVIQAGSIEKGSQGKFRAAYFGNIFVDTDNHFTQGENSADGTWYTFDDNVKFSFTDNTDVSGFQTHGAKTAQKVTNFSITIPADAKGCTPGYSYTTGPQPVTETIRVIAEDLSASQRSDFDFNDVVFDVYWTHTPGSSDNQTVKVIVRAAGGELPIFIGNIDNALEIHNLFANVNDESRHITSKTMMNTYAGQHTSYTCPEVLVESNWWSGSDIQTIAKSIKIYVRKSGTDYELTAEKGEAACKIAVLQDYEWCNEREDINEKYNGNFEKYVKGQIADYEWYK